MARPPAPRGPKKVPYIPFRTSGYGIGRPPRVALARGAHQSVTTYVPENVTGGTMTQPGMLPDQTRE